MPLLDGKNIINRVLNSPSLMTWGSLALQLLGFVVLLPLVLNRLSVEDVNLWLLFSTVVGIINLADFGFRPTFIRAIAYAYAETSDKATESFSRKKCTSYSLAEVIGAMRHIYRRIFVVTLLISLLIGSVFVASPVSYVSEPILGWIAWVTVAITGSIVLWGGMYSAFLHGAENVALCQRWEIICGIPALIVSISVLIVGGGLLGLVVTTQLGLLVRVWVTRALVMKTVSKNVWQSPGGSDAAIISSIWSPAWRSGLGILMTSATIQGTGVAYAQLAPPDKAASYLLALRLIQIIGSFSNVPFYSRIPLFSRLYAEKNFSVLIKNAQKSMFLSNWLFVIGVVVIAIASAPLLSLLGSNTSLVSADAWLLLGLAMLLERIGAKHIQMYSSSNHILWHFANGGAGFIMIISMPALYFLVGVYGLVLGMLLAYFLFYAPFAIYVNYRHFDLNFFEMDFYASFFPIVILFGFALLSFCNNSFLISIQSYLIGF